MSAERYVNCIDHECGCRTGFDTLYWRSHAFRRCDFHRAKIEVVKGVVTGADR